MSMSRFDPRSPLVPGRFQTLRMRDLRLGAGMHFLYRGYRGETLYRIERLNSRRGGMMSFIFCDKIQYGPVDPEALVEVWVDDPDEDTLDDVTI